MADVPAKVHAEIEYCVPWSYHSVAFWMGSELAAAGGSQIAVTLTPGQAGVFKVTLNGEVSFDKGELGRYPTLPDAKELKAKVINMIEASTV